MLEAILERGLTPTVPSDYERWHCLHWPLAMPEVMERGGFDAIVGNPPFLGGMKISPAMGQNLREWFVSVLARNESGNADLVAYFFLRAFSLLNGRGTLGLIDTNTVAQGRTRKVGLDQMVNFGFTITRTVAAGTGERRIYVRLMSPSGAVIGASGNFTYEQKSLESSASKTIEYTGEEQHVSVVVAAGNDFLAPGRYSVHLFCDGQMIGSSALNIEQ